MKRYLYTFFLSIAASTLALPAQADLMIAPTRVVLENGTRSAELVIVNKSDEEAAFRISIENRRMLEDGSMEKVETANPDENFADGIIRYSPRRVIMDAGGRQTIRISARTTGLEPGEYRSHLRLMSAPTSAGRTLQTAASGQSDGISIQLIAIRSLTIPVIVRVGDLNAEVVIDDAMLKNVFPQTVEGEEGLTPSAEAVPETHLEISLKREGTESTYGNIEVYVSGEAEPVYFAKGIAVYTPNAARIVKLRIPPEITERLANKQVRILYKSANANDPKTFAEYTADMKFGP